MLLVGILFGYLLYLEVVYHVGSFGVTACNPLLTIAFLMIVASLEALLVGKAAQKWKKPVFWIVAILDYVFFFAQFVYMGIFKQPLLMKAVMLGAGDALSDYWREALEGVLAALPFLALMAVPLVIAGILIRFKKLSLPEFHSMQVLRAILAAGMGVIFAVTFLMIGKYIKTDYYEDYTEFFDPLTVAEKMGVTVMVQRDVALNVEKLAGDIWMQLTQNDSKGSGSLEDLAAENKQGQSGMLDGVSDNDLEKDTISQPDEEGDATDPFPDEGEPAEEITDTSPNELPIDWAKLANEASSKAESWLVEYMSAQEPTKKNEYTGLFEGYNLIFLTAEGFSPYVVREDITPTLYRLTHSGFVFTNYYVPVWSTSTSDGEYVNLTGLVPDGQFSMRESGDNDMAFSMANYFIRRGVGCMAFHNNSLSYYNRHITHNNIGYIFKAAKLGDLSEKEWGDSIFPMENPNYWPASDLSMMKGSMPEYIEQESFHIYYMTVSGHMNYNFAGNRMSSINRDAVAGLDMSENARAYIACHVELDKALEYLLQQLEEAGQLEKTVICLSADHYPYAMEQSQMDELAGKSVADYLDLYRNNLILWNAGMTDQPIIVDKVCGAMDLLPTLLNLFGFEYDSRLYAGKDIFSEDEGMVIFKDRSFITDTVIYDRNKKVTTWRADLMDAGILNNEIAGYIEERGIAGIYEDYQKADAETGILRIAGSMQQLDSEDARTRYFEEKQQEVKDRYQFSAYILENDYYHAIMGALPEEYQFDRTNPAANWERAGDTETPDETESTSEAGEDVP